MVWVVYEWFGMWAVNTLGAENLVDFGGDVADGLDVVCTGLIPCLFPSDFLQLLKQGLKAGPKDQQHIYVCQNTEQAKCNINIPNLSVENYRTGQMKHQYS